IRRGRERARSRAVLVVTPGEKEISARVHRPYLDRRGPKRGRRLTGAAPAAATRALPRPGAALLGRLHAPFHIGAQGEDAAVRADIVGDAGAQGERNLLGERFEDLVLEFVAAGALPREDEHDLLLEIDLLGDHLERVLAEVLGGLALRLDDDRLVPC